MTIKPNPVYRADWQISVTDICRFRAYEYTHTHVSWALTGGAGRMRAGGDTTLQEPEPDIFEAWGGTNRAVKAD